KNAKIFQVTQICAAVLKVGKANGKNALLVPKKLQHFQASKNEKSIRTVASPATLAIVQQPRQQALLHRCTHEPACTLGGTMIVDYS
ncbi:unnamed protein product, partial [Ceratitis capitata]